MMWWGLDKKLQVWAGVVSKLKDLPSTTVTEKERLDEELVPTQSEHDAESSSREENIIAGW